MARNGVHLRHDVITEVALDVTHPRIPNIDPSSRRSHSARIELLYSRSHVLPLHRACGMDEQLHHPHEGHRPAGADEVGAVVLEPNEIEGVLHLTVRADHLELADLRRTQ